MGFRKKGSVTRKLEKTNQRRSFRQLLKSFASFGSSKGSPKRAWTRHSRDRSDTSTSAESRQSSHSAAASSAGGHHHKATARDIKEFQLLKVLGRGSFGKVLLVKDKRDTKLYAMKVFDKVDIIEKRQVMHTLTERNIMCAFAENPFMTTLRCSFQTKDKLFLVSDFCSGGEVFYHLKVQERFSEELACFYAAQIGLALKALHDENIVFRDLKSENLLLDQRGHVVVTDFGLARQNVDELAGATSICGTVAYIAPEMVHCSRGGPSYGTMVDWWSLGTLLYDMVVGHPPFSHESTKIMCQRILEGKVKYPVKRTPSLNFQSLVNALLSVAPVGRLGSRQQGGFEAFRRHPFLTSHLGDWSSESVQGMDAPFVPRLNTRKAYDLQNFDSVFTRADPTLRMSPASKNSTKALKRNSSTKKTKAGNGQGSQALRQRTVSHEQELEAMEFCEERWNCCIGEGLPLSPTSSLSSRLSSFRSEEIQVEIGDEYGLFERDQLQAYDSKRCVHHQHNHNQQTSRTFPVVDVTTGGARSESLAPAADGAVPHQLSVDVNDGELSQDVCAA